MSAPYTLKEIPSKIEFELDDGTILNFDAAELLSATNKRLENLYTLATDGDEEAIQTLESEWMLPFLRPLIKEEFQRHKPDQEPSDVIYVMAYNAIVLAITVFKKKLSDSLVSAFGTTSTQPLLSLPKWKLWIVTSILYLMREISVLEKLGLRSNQKTSTPTS